MICRGEISRYYQYGNNHGGNIMEIRQLKYFVKLCEDMNFSKAASNLYMTQQALSQSIKNLENELGVALFIRNKNGVELTETAVYMLTEAKKFLEEYDAMVNNIQNFSMAMKGTITMSIPPGALHQIVPVIMKQFRETYPEIDFVISEMADFECEESVFSGKYDVGVSVAPVDESKFEFFPLINEDAFLLVNRKNRLAANDTIKFSDLKNEKMLVMDKTFKWHEHILSRCEDVSVAYSSRHPSTLAELVNQNLGVTILIPYEIKKNISNDTIAIPIDPEEKFRYTAGLILKKGCVTKHIVKVLVKYIVDYFEERNPL